MDDVLRDLGAVVARRVWLSPTPGTATEADALAVAERDRLYLELFDGYLAEKGAGPLEVIAISHVLTMVANFVADRRLGLVLGQVGMLRLRDGLIRCPDVAFTRRDRLKQGWMDDPFAPIPDLAIKVVGAGNTKRETARKVAEYLAAGVRLVWVIEPRRREAHAHSTVDGTTRFDEHEELDGGDLLPGFRLPHGELLEQAEYYVGSRVR